MMRMEEDCGCAPLQCCLLLRGSPGSCLQPHMSRACSELHCRSGLLATGFLYSQVAEEEREWVCVCIERELVLFIVWVQYYQAYTDTAQKLRPVWRLWEGTWVMYLLFISSCHLWRVRDEWWGLSVLDEGCEGLASNPQWVWGGRLVFFPSQSDTIGWMYPHL